MIKDLERSLYRAATLTFEELAFMLPVQELEEEHRNAQMRTTASIEFHGALTGKLVITVCGDIMPTLAANMLGEASPPSLQDQRDALGEIANVICGNVLPMISDPKDVFHLGAPQIIESTQPLLNHSHAPIAVVQIGLDDKRADLMLYLYGETSVKEQSL